MDRCTLFQNLTSLATTVGTVSRANMHSKDWMRIEGTTDDGRDFYVSLHVQEKECKENGN